MSMNRRALSGFSGLSLLAAAVCILMVLTAGCEDSSGTVRLTVTPSDVTMTGASQTFTVGNTTTNGTTGGLRELSFPLVWSLSSPSLGSVRPVGDTGAVYTRTSLGGINILTVKDQYGAEGQATIRQ